MRVDPAIAALRTDRSPQRRAQAAMFAARDAWREPAEIAPVLAEFERFGVGASLEVCPVLAGLFDRAEAAGRFAAALCTSFARVLAREPFGQLPFRHGFDGMASTLLLARSGSARLSLVAHEPGERRVDSVAFSDAVRHDAVIAGEGCAMRVKRRLDGHLAPVSRRLACGDRITLDLASEALLVERVERRLVVLRLHRTTNAPGPVREYALADGRLLRQSAGDIRHSRQEMMLALLGRMKRFEAAPLMAEMACEEGPDALRWQALREGLALDTASGFAALCRIARSPLDPLSEPAGVLRAQLIEAHPALLAFEEAQCRG